MHKVVYRSNSADVRTKTTKQKYQSFATQNVVILPFPLTDISPRMVTSKSPSSKWTFVSFVTWTRPLWPVDSMREATFTWKSVSCVSNVTLQYHQIGSTAEHESRPLRRRLAQCGLRPSMRHGSRQACVQCGLVHWRWPSRTMPHKYRPRVLFHYAEEFPTLSCTRRRLFPPKTQIANLKSGISYKKQILIYKTHFVRIVSCDNCIKLRKQFVEHLNNLKWATMRTEIGKLYNIDKTNSGRLI